MNDYVVLIGLVLILILYLFYFKEKLIKWEERDSIEKSYSLGLTILLLVGIILWTYKILK